MKKFLSIILVALLLVTAIVPAFADGDDVAERLTNGEVRVRAKWDSYNYVSFSYVDALNAAGYYKGEDGNGVEGSEPLTRWQFCLIMLRAMTGDLVDENWVTYLQEYGEEDIVYDDVRAILNMTYEEQQADPELFNFYKSSLGAILFMMHNKYIIGSADADGEINLRPNDTISFTEAVTIVVRMLGWNSTAMNYNYPQNYLDVADEIGVFGHYELEDDELVWYGLDMGRIALDDVVTYEMAAQLVFALWTCNVYDNELGEIVANPYADRLEELEDEVQELLALEISSFEMGAIVGDGYMIFRNDKGWKNLDDPQCQATFLRVKDSYALPGAGVVSVPNGTTVGEVIAEFISNGVGDRITAWNFGKYGLEKRGGTNDQNNEYQRISDVYSEGDVDIAYEDIIQDEVIAAMIATLEALGGTMEWKDGDGNLVDVAGDPTLIINTKKSCFRLPTTSEVDSDEGSRVEVAYDDADLEIDGWDLQRIAKIRWFDNAFWAFYELDEEGQPIYDSKLPLILGTIDRGSDTSGDSIQLNAELANAWTNYELNVNTTLAREYLGEDDTMLILHNGSEWYVDMVQGEVLGMAQAITLDDIFAAAPGIVNLNEVLGLDLDDENCEVLPIIYEGEDDVAGYIIEVLATTTNADPEVQWLNDSEPYAFGSACGAVQIVNSRVYTQECLTCWMYVGALYDLNEEFGVEVEWWEDDAVDYDSYCEIIHLANEALETMWWAMDTDANGAIDYIVAAGFVAN
jgi:hypothetical protein